MRLVETNGYATGAEMDRLFVLGHPAIGNDQSVLADIYQDDTNIAIWRRPVPASVVAAVETGRRPRRGFKASMTVSPESALAGISEALRTEPSSALSRDIAALVDMFCYLFDLKRVGLRLANLDSAMCPRFHVDHIPCRLVTTYWGAATEWLPHRAVNRDKLGFGSDGHEDAQSGLYRHPTDIQSLSCGDVALLKGAAWEGNEQAGLVHRSPAVQAGDSRLLLTLDFSH